MNGHPAIDLLRHSDGRFGSDFGRLSGANRRSSVPVRQGALERIGRYGAEEPSAVGRWPLADGQRPTARMIVGGARHVHAVSESAILLEHAPSNAAGTGAY